MTATQDPAAYPLAIACGCALQNLPRPRHIRRDLRLERVQVREPDLIPQALYEQQAYAPVIQIVCEPQHVRFHLVSYPVARRTDPQVADRRPRRLIVPSQ